MFLIINIAQVIKWILHFLITNESSYQNKCKKTLFYNAIISLIRLYSFFNFVISVYDNIKTTYKFSTNKINLLSRNIKIQNQIERAKFPKKKN